MIRLKIPNLLRLYLNPFVAQTCVTLNEMVHSLWPETKANGSYSSFLANSGEEALSGAVKLARYTQHQRAHRKHPSVTGLNSQTRDPSTRVFLVDDADWFEGFASVTLDAAQSQSQDNPNRIEFIPDAVSVTTSEFVRLCESQRSITGIVVLSPSAIRGDAGSGVQPAVLLTSIRNCLASEAGVLIACMARDHFAAALQATQVRFVPDIVVFDESFTLRQVPFGAIVSRSDLYSQWTAKRTSTFHSTTYQPNTISTMHFLKCLKQASPEFYEPLQPLLSPLMENQDQCLRVFRDLYSPGLTQLISASGFGTEEVTASGHYVRVGAKRYFDGIGGVACSLRGHNPDSWVSEIKAMDSVADVRREVVRRLHELTGLRHHVPAVSGASAVEQALKLGLIAQSPKKVIVALKGGFGGKTLLALSGTSKASYRKHLDPLYPDVLFVDPFAADAIGQLRRIVETGTVAIIQLELIQGVGGVREIPGNLLDYLQVVRQESGALLFVDEIQTGLFRTGPFVRSAELSLVPDLMTIGKGTSDMMFPFAMTLYGDRVNYLLKSRSTKLPLTAGSRYGYEIGYRSVLNTLQRNDVDAISENVTSTGQMFQNSLQRALAGIGIVKDIRTFGLLIGIELDPGRTMLQLAGLNTVQLYLLQMMQDRDFPLLTGFCQYEPNILKLTPPLTVTPEEVESIARTFSNALRTSAPRLLMTGVRALLRALR